MKNIVDFTQPDEVRWNIVNDGVMGGLSSSDLELTESETALVLWVCFTGQQWGVRFNPSDIPVHGPIGVQGSHPQGPGRWPELSASVQDGWRLRRSGLHGGVRNQAE